MAKKGYFVLTDISGYTEFLTKSELDHAQDTLQSLFDVQIAQIQHPLLISGFRGDAIFMYVPETNFCEPQTLLEALEGLYFVFADTLRQMILNTTCPCRACQNMKNLDLKMVIHHGEYAVQKLGDHEELLGAEVIVPHRMLKNHVTEQTGIRSYALFSEAAAEALRLSELAYPLAAHSETYEHIGEVKMQVLDLRRVWEREQDKKRFVVPPGEAWIHLEWNAPYAPAVLWEYMTSLKLELKAQEYDLVERTDTLGGRMQPETTYHCAHGAAHFFTKILDWKPFDYISVRLETGGLVLIVTRRIIPEGSGSRIAIDVAEPPGATEEVKKFVYDAYDEIGRKFMKLLEADAANGIIAVP